MIKLSLIVPVLNSHKIVQRHMLFFRKMRLPDDVEIIYVDDGSDPPIKHIEPKSHKHFNIIRTNDTRPWTWALARNIGARMSAGRNLLMTDLDYIIPETAIMAGRAFEGDYIGFRREFAILDEIGNFHQDIESLAAYGWPKERYATRKFELPPHPNNFVIRKDLFLEMGGYREDLVERPYPQGEDNDFKKKRKRWEREGKLKVSEIRPTLYMFPNGKWCAGGDVDTNPFDLFHDLTRKTKKNYWYQEQLKHA